MMIESPVVTIVYEQGEEGWVVASIPEVPGAHRQGRTREEARANVIDALRGILGLRFGGHPEVTEGAYSEPLELVSAGSVRAACPHRCPTDAAKGQIAGAFESWRVPYDGGPVLRLFASVGLFSLVEADNGRLLAYVTGGFVEGCSSGPQRVVVRDTVTGAIRALRTPRPEVTDLALSPDFGLAVVEPSTDSKQGLHIRVVDYRTATSTAQGRPSDSRVAAPYSLQSGCRPGWRLCRTARPTTAGWSSIRAR